jgi:hypothetical protein
MLIIEVLAGIMIACFLISIWWIVLPVVVVLAIFAKMGLHQGVIFIVGITVIGFGITFIGEWLDDYARRLNRRRY